MRDRTSLGWCYRREVGGVSGNLHGKGERPSENEGMG